MRVAIRSSILILNIVGSLSAAMRVVVGSSATEKD